ncbi:MAG: metallophosphoesterase family protein [Kiritimatiellia bacterium]
MKATYAGIGRRDFVGGILAGMGMAGCRSTGLFAAKPDLTFGAISDLHVTTRASTGMFRRALRYFRSRGADAVLVAGDLTDWGLKSSLEYVREAWAEEMAGSGAVPLFITGNHDYDGWQYGDMTLDMHLQGYSEDEALSRAGMKACWERTFGEPFDGIRRRTVKGFDFISSEWHVNGRENGDADMAKWLAEHAAELRGSRPFFFFRHSPLAGTVSSSKRDGDRALTDALRAFPNCVAFNGHTHWTFNDERSIWQGGFTAVSVPSTSYTSLPRDCENGFGPRQPTVGFGMERLPSRENLKEAEGFFVRVFPGRVEIERHDFETGADTAAPWIFPVPVSADAPYAFAAHARRTPVPQFPSGAAVRTSFVNADLRNGQWAIFVALDFPSAAAAGGRVYDYEVRVVGEDGSRKGMKRFLSPGFYRPRADEPATQHFRYNGFDLPETGRFRLEVVARNCFGAESRPLRSDVFAPQPGKDRAR